MVYGRILEDRGALMATIRVYHRVWQLYVAHVFLFMVFMALIGQMSGQWNNPLYVEELRAADFLREPGVAVAMALALLFHPAYMDILPLYITLLAVLPLFMVLARWHWPLALALSFGLWLAVQFNDAINLVSYPGPHKWFFNPFAWQVLFLFAAFLGCSQIKGRNGWLRARPLLLAAIAMAVFGFTIRLNWTFNLFMDPMPFLKETFFLPALSKTDMSVIRLLNVLATALVVAALIPRTARFLSSRAAWPVMVCGRHSLHIFCLGILLSVLGQWMLNELQGGVWMQNLIIVMGIVIMIGVAALVDWYGKSLRGRRDFPADEKAGQR